jgi:hypothetical protein
MERSMASDMWVSTMISASSVATCAPHIDGNRRRCCRQGLCLRCDTAGTARPGLHSGRHAATEKQGQPQAFAATGWDIPGISAQLLVMRDKVP